MEFASQDGRTFRGSGATETYLVLLVGPNEGAIANIGATKVPRILLFSEIWEDLGSGFNEDGLMAEIREDIPRVLDVLRRPTQGKLINKRFLNLK